MRNVRMKVSNWMLKVFILITSSSVWADLPKPPDSDMATGNKSWIDVGQANMYKVVSIASVIIGAVILLGVAAGTLKAYHHAQEKEDLGHFFKTLLIGLLAAALGVGLVYAGFQIVELK